ncbi:MAG: FtsX-like permease family protein [Cyclobacteriaceae bacterium]
MNLPNFISKRISKEADGSFSQSINRIAVISIALGLSSLLVAFMVLGGFKAKIREKIVDFNGHLIVTKYVFNSNIDDHPISLNSDFFNNWQEDFPYITHVQQFANKPALLKTNEEVEGILLKGLDATFDTARFNKNLIEGRFPDFPETGYALEILISKMLANQMLLHVGDKALLYFVQDPPRYRNVTITGIYETGLEEFDQRMVFGDLGLIRRINNWPDSLAGGLEVYVDDFSELDAIENRLFEEIDYDLYVDKVTDKFVQLFDWLSLIDVNVQIFLFLVLFVAGFNMISILIILILERIHMIGILSAMGSPDSLIRRIFFYNGIRLILKGMVIANVIGLGLGLLQKEFKIISLDAKNYYMDAVPISISWTEVLGLNIICLLIVGMALFIPLLIVNRIRAINAIRFD